MRKTLRSFAAEATCSNRRDIRSRDFTSYASVGARNKTPHQTCRLKIATKPIIKRGQREAEEYRYNLDLAREVDSEEYEVTKKTLYQELAEAKAEQEKAWDEREKTISDREKAYAEAKAKVEAFPEELEKNIKNGKDNGRNIGNLSS
jgi:hypothetical protein